MSQFNTGAFRAVIAGALGCAAIVSGCGGSSSDAAHSPGGAAGSASHAGMMSSAGAPAAHAGAGGHAAAGTGSVSGGGDVPEGGAVGDAGAIGDGGSIGLAGAPSAGAAGTPSTQPECAPFAQLSLTDFKQTKAAGPGQSALFSATLTNLSDKFIDYTGGILTCQEEGTLVDAVGVPNWNFGILGHGVQLLTFSAQISASAAPGATVHCTAHAGAGLADGKDCANAASLSLDFKVK